MIELPAITEEATAREYATRKALESYEGQRCSFRARVGSRGNRSQGGQVETLCLNEVCMVDKWGEETFASDHVWVDVSSALERAQLHRGEHIEFKADVVFYLKGGLRYMSTKMGRKECDPAYTGCDYGLRRVGCVKRRRNEKETGHE